MKKRPDGKPCGAFGACRNGRCVEPVCAGQNACANSGAPKCSAGETECFCFLTAATGKPFCGQNAHQAATCDACAKPAVCITTGALCPFSAVCALPCSDPR